MNQQRRMITVYHESHQDSMTELKNTVTTEENEEEEEEKYHRRPWSNLPKDVLSEIMNLLSIPDQIRVTCVCKNFQKQQPIHHHRPSDQLPWLVTCHDSESDGFLCKLFNPLEQNPKEIYRLSGAAIGGWFRPSYVTSKDGWLFFLKEKDRYVDELFLFCPYTKEIVLLPSLHHGFWESKNQFFMAGERRRILTFSSTNPRSEDCKFFAAYYLYDNEIHGKITICCYNNNNRQENRGEEWRTKTTFYGMKSVKITNLLYMEGNLYIMNKEGCLGIYNVSTERWVFNNYWPNNYRIIDHQSCSLIADDHEEEGKGKGKIVLLVVMNHLSEFELYRMDLEGKEWIRVSGLRGNEALFIGNYPWECNFLVRSSYTEEEGGGNKIFCRKIEEMGFDRRFQIQISYHWKYYDLKESQYFGCCDDMKFKYFVPREEEKGGLIRPNKNPLALWIQPPNQALLNRFSYLKEEKGLNSLLM